MDNKYFTPEEVAAHNTPGDCWVSFHGKVYNLTPLYEKYAGRFALCFVLLRNIWENICS